MENQLQVIVKESGLDATKAQFILDNFQNYFALASEWEAKAKTIVVTSGDQKDDMKLAREGRLELREKRIAVEKSRKDLKEQCLREGKAIDGIANILKALIVPIEEYLEQQERFVEIQEEKKAEARRLEIERRMAEEDRIKAEKEVAEQERLKAENARLAKEAKDRDEKYALERKAQEDLLAKERAKADADRKAIEDKAKAERMKADTERREAEEKARKEKEKAKAKLEAERQEVERLEQLLKDQIECPKCGHKFKVKK